MFLNPWYGQVGGPAPEDASLSPPQSKSHLPETKDEYKTDADDSLNAMAIDAVDSAAAAVTTSRDPIALIQENLRSGWTAHVTSDGRLFYCKYVYFCFLFLYFSI